MMPGATKHEEILVARKLAYAKITVAILHFSTVWSDDIYQVPTATSNLRNGIS